VVVVVRLVVVVGFVVVVLFVVVGFLVVLLVVVVGFAVVVVVVVGSVVVVNLVVVAVVVLVVVDSLVLSVEDEVLPPTAVPHSAQNASLLSMPLPQFVQYLSAFWLPQATSEIIIDIANNKDKIFFIMLLPFFRL
jgi:hypothetical protein